MTVVANKTFVAPIDGLGEPMSFADPKPGEGWVATVPAGKAWRMWGGGCSFHASKTVANRIPALLLTDGGDTTYFCHYNIQQGTGSPIKANETEQICYYEQAALQPTHYTSLPQPVGCKAIWLPAGSVIVGHFESIQVGDQVSGLELLIEEVSN